MKNILLVVAQVLKNLCCLAQDTGKEGGFCEMASLPVLSPAIFWSEDTKPMLIGYNHKIKFVSPAGRDFATRAKLVG